MAACQLSFSYIFLSHFLVLNSISFGVMEILGWRKRLSYSVEYITSDYTKFFLRSLMVYEFAHRYMHIAYVD
jgi:hypothetical protein